MPAPDQLLLDLIVRRADHQERRLDEIMALIVDVRADAAGITGKLDSLKSELTHMRDMPNHKFPGWAGWILTIASGLSIMAIAGGVRMYADLSVVASDLQGTKVMVQELRRSPKGPNE